MPFIATAFSAISTFAASSVIGGALVRLGVGLLLSAASRALMPQPQVRLNPRTFSTRNPVTPRDVVYGRVRKGGAVVWIDESGKDDKYLDMVVVFAGHEIERFGRIYFDGKLFCEEGQTSATGRWSGFGGAYRMLGGDDQSAQGSLLFARPDAWSAAHRLRGCAYAYIRVRWNKDKPESIPNVSADIWGKNDILDPRDGTRGYSTNPALCVADYLSWSRARGGLGVPYSADGIDEDDLIEAANICDEVVDTPGGGTEARYTCNGVLTLSAESTPQERIRGLLTAMAGSMTDATPYRIRAGSYRTPELAFGLDDLRGPINVQTLQSGDEVCNGTRGVFVSPDNSWQPDDFPAVQSDVYLAEDEGVELWHDINLPFTTSAGMAQRLARIDLERTRRQITVTTTGSAKWLAAQPGDVIELTVARYGWTDKAFEIQRMTPRFDDGAIVVDLVLRETASLVYAWDATEAEIYAAAPQTTLPDPWDVPPPGFIDVEEELYTTRDRSVKALARLSWVAAPSGYVSEYRVRAMPPGGTWREVGVTTDTTFDVLDVQPGEWQFEVTPVTSFGAAGSAVSRTYQVVGLSAPPAALGGVALQAAGGLAILRWDRVTDLDVIEGGRIAVRHSPATSGAVWSASRAIDRAPGSATLIAVPLMPGTYLLRAEDTSNVGGPVSTVTTAAAQVIAFSSAGLLQEDDDFLGTATDVTVSTIGGTPGLVLTDSETDPEGQYEFAAGLDLTTVKRVRLRSEIALSAYNALDDFDARPGNVDEWASWDGADGGEVDCFLEVRTTPDDPAGTPAWGPWSRLDAAEVEARGIEARAQMTTTDGEYTPFVTQLRLYADEVA
ncbi:phage tail protein [Roseibacterium sp. SDUM158017]|uniref:phage tail protein n=1 Tax=Roseicyclus salinarum TaxID=3036773 RepID=UPI002414D8E8|nr:phage tail protein [Roseibacterium sp. SDUM158017]MDG4650123.1 phage tail protein [Roseibacterium sp. SDUM158017]